MNPTNGASFGRDTGHESDQIWNSYGKRIFNMAMQASGMTFENLGWLDVEADNSSIIMSTFVRSCKNNPPLRMDGQPCDSQTVVKA